MRVGFVWAEEPEPEPELIRTCPVDGTHSFSNTWQAPRPDGRLHVGTDIMSEVGTRVVAIEDGYIETGVNPVGGNVIFLNADSGDRYYYAHLDEYVSILPTTHVRSGMYLGRVGASGNADPDWPHLHIERHVDGEPINPYETISEICDGRRERNLGLLARAIQQHEGFYPGSISYDNNNPGNLQSWSTQIGTSRGFAVFPTYEVGYNALRSLLRASCDNSWTLLQLMNSYAPASDNNDPYGYASILARTLGVTLDTPLDEIYCK